MNLFPNSVTTVQSEAKIVTMTYLEIEKNHLVFYHERMFTMKKTTQ